MLFLFRINIDPLPQGGIEITDIQFPAPPLDVSKIKRRKRDEIVIVAGAALL